MKTLTIVFTQDTPTQEILQVQETFKRRQGVVSTVFHADKCSVDQHRKLRAEGIRRCPVCNLYVGAEVLRRK